MTARAFSSEVGTGSREEHASKRIDGAFPRFGETRKCSSHITWTRDQASWHGEFQGAEFGSEVSIIFNRIDRPGEGPELHRHPYSETFIVRRGTAVFSDGRSSFEASAGAVVVVPAGVPHRFTCKGDQLEMIDIHASRSFVTEWLDQPTESASHERDLLA